MKNFSSLFLLPFLIFFLNSCQNNAPPKPAHLRVITMINHPSAELTIQGKGKQKGVRKKLSLAYGMPTDYNTLPPGKYKITLQIKGKPLLSAGYVLGKDGYYTLLATGLLPKKWKVNPRTTMYQLKYIFAGEELESTNNYLPQWFLMRDNYDGSKTSSYIRLINANPYTATLTVKKGDATLKSGLAYPMESDMTKIKPGSHLLKVFYGKIDLARKTIHPRAGYIYTAVIGSKKNEDNKLTISLLENPSRTLLRSK